MKEQSFLVLKLIPEQLDATGYHLFVNVKVNNKRCRFLLDTGASHSVVDKSFFEKNFGKRNLKTVKQSTTGLHSSTTESHFCKLKDLSIGKFSVKNQVVAAIDLSHVNQTYRQIIINPIRGIIGSDVLMDFNMIIDYGAMKIFVPLIQNNKKLKQAGLLR